MKAIIGMITSPSSLCDTICSGEQYRRVTPCGMWYLSLKTSILAMESTRCLNLPIGQVKGKQLELINEEIRTGRPRRLAKEKKRSLNK